MHDTLPKPEKRKPLTRVQFATLILAQEGRCGCGCGQKLRAAWIIDEHLQALDFLGSNDLSNRSLWDYDCSKRKTARDLKAAAKGKRIRGETGTGPKKAIPSRGFGRMPESRSPSKWQSAGFNQRLRKRMNGKVERVET
jgi:hypothetical protein